MDLLRPSGNRYNLRRDLNLKEWNVNAIINLAVDYPDKI